MCTYSGKLWGFQAIGNPHNNYVHVTGYPLLHGVFIHFLWGKHLQCSLRAFAQIPVVLREASFIHFMILRKDISNSRTKTEGLDF